MHKQGSTALIALFGISLALTVLSRLQRAQPPAPIYNRPDMVASYSTHSGSVDVIVALTCLVLVLVAVALLVFLVKTIQQQQPQAYQSKPISLKFQQRPSSRSQPPQTHSQPPHRRTQRTANHLGSAIPSPANVSTKARQLQSRLLVLLNGDRKIAERLLAQVQKAHPGRSEEWWLEKVIHDLERDRRG